MRIEEIIALEVRSSLGVDLQAILDLLNPDNLENLSTKLDQLLAQQAESDLVISTIRTELTALSAVMAEAGHKVSGLVVALDAVSGSQASRHQEILDAIASVQCTAPQEPTDPEEPVDPEDPEDPMEPGEPDPTDPQPFVPVVVKVNAFTDSTTWNKGTYREKAGVSVPFTPETDAAYVVGAHLKLADGQVRKIYMRNHFGGNMSLFLEGPQLDPLLVGSPKNVENTLDPINITQPELPPPVEGQHRKGLLGMRGANFAGMSNNPSFSPYGKPAQLGTHYRTSANVNGQPEYFLMYGGHLDPEQGDRFLVRMPFAGERLFSIQDGVVSLHESYALEMDQMINDALEYGGQTILDWHGYCRFYQATPKNEDGSLKYPMLQRVQQTVNGVTTDSQWFPFNHPDCVVTYDIFAECWRLVAQRYVDHPGVIGYGLMNEPHNRGSQDNGMNVDQLWKANVQKAINSIRTVDADTWIMVAGCAYSTAKNWRNVNVGLELITGTNIMFEAHQYPDSNGDGGGSWPKNVTHSIDPVARVNDWNAAISWCREQGRPLFAGEFGCPIEYQKSDGSTYVVQGAAEYFANLYAHFEEHGVASAQWLAGPGDNDSYANGMDQDNGTLKANSNALMSYIGESVPNYETPL